MTDLSGRSAIVTGGLSGIGSAIAGALAAAGARVAVGSRSAGADGDPPDPVHDFAGQLDVRDSASVQDFADRARRSIGAIDILVNAAGITAEQPVCGHGDDLWNTIIDTNLTGAFRMTREVLPQMIAGGWGRVINIGSTAASAGWADNPAYCASKSGLLGLTRCVALEGAAHAVTCVMISPGWVETGLMRRDVAEIVAREGRGRTTAQAFTDIAASNPQKRILQAGEIAALAVFLCSDAARGITMDEIRVTGGAAW